MARVTGGRAVVEILAEHRVEHAFGVVGTALLEVTDALYEHPTIRYVGVRHEQNGAHMADAYARVRGTHGVMLVGQPGPGCTNVVSGLAQSRHAFSPVVAIAGHVMSSHLDRDGYQEVDQQRLFEPVTKSTTTVRRADRIPEYLRDAFRISQSGRRGPAVVNIPSDFLGAEIELTKVDPIDAAAAGRAAPAGELVARVTQLIEAAERPVIVAGGGVTWARAGDRVLRLAERIGAPVVASSGHADAVANDHPLFAGHMGPRGNAVARDLVRNADLLLALGTRFAYNSTLYEAEQLPEPARIVQVDIEPTAIGRYFDVGVGIVADAGAMVDSLLEAVPEAAAPSAWVERFREDRTALLAARDAEVAGGTPLQLTTLTAAIRRALPRDVIITLDTGTTSGQIADLLPTYQTPGLLTPLDFGLVGFSYAAGLGAKAAAPHRPVLSLLGDGSFTMTMGEIGTAVDAGLNTVALVMNNGSWGAEKAYQRDFYGGRYVGSDITTPPFDEVARAFGVSGVRAETADDVTSALVDAFAADRPTVIDVPVDPDAITSYRKDTFAHRTTHPEGSA